MFKSVLHTDDSPAVVDLVGDLDTSASDVFVEDVSKLFENGCNSVVLDMSQLEFLSSSGLRKLLIISRMAASKGGRMTVRNVSPDIRQIFSLTGFDSLLGLE